MASDQAHQQTAAEAYDRMAPYYDTFSSHHDYWLWHSHLFPALREHGLRGNRLLDVACGTGKSFEPLIGTDWRVSACDLSAQMLAEAKRKFGDAVRLEVADMRRLPVLGEFDLVWTLGDVVNYLTDEQEVVSALTAMRANLAPWGLLLFDVNTLLSHREFYGETDEMTQGAARLIWQGHAAPDSSEGGIVEASFHVYPRGADSPAVRAIHRQRHYRVREVQDLLERSGLECLGVYGHDFTARLERPVDESRHTKAVFIARRQYEDGRG